MDRVETYVGETVYEWLFSKQAQNDMVGLSKVAAAMLGTGGMVNGLPCTQTTVPSMQVSIGQGELYQMASLEATVCGTLPSDTVNTVLKQGVLLGSAAPFNLPASSTFAPPGTTGQSINYLIEAQYQDQDVSIDPTTGTTPVVLQYYNSANPATPWSGPNNSGATSNTFRNGVIAFQVKAGSAATTGTQITPTPDSGWLGMYVVTVAFGASTITNSNIAGYVGAQILPSGGIVRAIQSSALIVGADTGAANACAVNYSPAITSLTDNMMLWFKAKVANTGATTLNVNGLGATPVVGAAHAALQGGEIIANGKCMVVYNATLSSFVLIECTGAALQVAPATQSQHAVQAAQVQSSAFVNGVDTGAANACVVAYTPALAALTDGMVLWFKAVAANTGATTLNVNGLGAKPVVGAAHAALQGGEIIAAGKCQVVWNATLASFVLIECTGAALQVAPAVASGHAAQLAQFTGSVATNPGYFKIPFIDQGGVKRNLIIQFGLVGIPSTSAGTVGFYGATSVTFPIAFPTSMLGIYPSSQDQTGAAPYLTTWQSATLAGFTLMPHTSGSVANVNCQWLAIGC